MEKHPGACAVPLPSPASMERRRIGLADFPVGFGVGPWRFSPAAMDGSGGDVRFYRATSGALNASRNTSSANSTLPNGADT